MTPRLVESFRATLAPHVASTAADATPLGLHWCLAPDVAEARDLGPDGHPAKGGFLPPIPLPRRMWAASRIAFLGTIGPGERVFRRSTISKVEEKQGRSGSLFFVTVRHDLNTGAARVIEEVQTLVYRAASAGNGAVSPTADVALPAPYERSVKIDPVLLFRYSALTFNGHRIHYDAPYATEVEHYPGLVVHGPLQATLLLNFAAMIGDRTPRQFSFRGIRPATGSQVLKLQGMPGADSELALEVKDANGHVTMKATAQW
ncbi:MaoC family dehydratase N-terminal domain-containing protein [Rhizobium sp. TRM95111]|uniref:FAS1-like dehydratase domain-containing protein n=1 Tax=Rhizobium alarense TaxID=2846851 RepID=UPI001F458770|nr:MaoC family dehydratase N-terminal domain-containing protein [Rhizobium alarense]MCF3638814.1 MaoC family dehydratase N-terminal domain-containing protein [Rhizobium alarense]